MTTAVSTLLAARLVRIDDNRSSSRREVLRQCGRLELSPHLKARRNLIPSSGEQGTYKWPA
jgi:hypothetical protein